MPISTPSTPPARMADNIVAGFCRVTCVILSARERNARVAADAPSDAVSYQPPASSTASSARSARVQLILVISRRSWVICFSNASMVSFPEDCAPAVLREGEFWAGLSAIFTSNMGVRNGGRTP